MPGDPPPPQKKLTNKQQQQQQQQEKQIEEVAHIRHLITVLTERPMQC